MVYWDLNHPDEMAQFEAFQREKQVVEKAYLQRRIELRDAEAALRADPGNAALKGRVAALREQIRELEKQNPWLVAQVPVEMALWGTIGGLL